MYKPSENINKETGICFYLSIISLNATRLNSSIKRLDEDIRPNDMLLTKKSFHY
jgi:hypothetical protein